MEFDGIQLEVPLERPASPPRRQRACLQCSKAKARCNFQDKNIGKHCDRCKRLNTDCAPQTTKSLRRPRQLKPYLSRVASLEQKIDGIASLLASGQQTSPPVSPIPSSSQISFETTDSPMTTPESLGHSSDYRPFHDTQQAPQALPQQYVYHVPDASQLPPTPATPGYNLSWEQAELAVSEYKFSYMPNFPFVVIEPEMTAQELYHEKPFLFRVVLLVATQIPLERKRGMKRNVTAYLGQHLLVNEERSLDLLQGLLVFIAWGDLSFYLDRQITHLIHLAIGYAHNLGLTRVPPAFMEDGHGGGGSSRGLETHDAEEAMWARDPRNVAALEKIHNLEEQRTYLGCYYLMSVNAAQFARRNTFSSHYVNMCCSCLLQANEAASDFMLEKMVRLQQFVDRIFERFPVVKQGMSKTRRFSYLIQDEMTPIRAQLDKLAENVGHGHPQFTNFWLHYNYLLVRLYEPAIHLTDPPPNQGNYYRSQCLLYCLQAGKSFCTNLLSLPVEDWLFRAFITSAELLGVFVTMSRPAAPQHRRTLDLAAACQTLIEQFQLASGLLQDRLGGAPARVGDGGELPEKDAFLKYADKMVFIRTWYMARVAGEASMAPTEIEQSLFPTDWSYLASTESQFWLGLLPQVDWEIDF